MAFEMMATCGLQLEMYEVQNHMEKLRYIHVDMGVSLGVQGMKYHDNEIVRAMDVLLWVKTGVGGLQDDQNLDYKLSNFVIILRSSFSHTSLSMLTD